MENQNPVVEPTTPVATETVTTSTTTTAPAATVAATSTSKLPLILGVTAVVAVAAVGAAFLIFRPGQTTSTTPAGSGVNAANPQAAVETLNTRLSAFLKADNAEAVNAITGNTSVEGIEFKLTLNAADKRTNQTVGLVFSGKAASKDGQTGAFTGKGQLTAAGVEGLGNVSADIELQVGDAENLYFKLSNFSPAETAAFLPLIGLDLDTWYKFPVDANTVANPATASDLTNVDRERLDNNPLLINPRAANDRVVFGQTLKCLTADINPALMEGNTNMPFPVEYCGGDTALPMALGFNVEDTTSRFSLIVEIIDIPSFSVTAPADAKDAGPIFENLGIPGLGGATDGSGASGTMPDEQTRLMNPDDFDYDQFTPEELMAL